MKKHTCIHYDRTMIAYKLAQHLTLVVAKLQYKKQVIHIGVSLRYSGSVEPPAVSKFIQCRGCMVNVYGESSQIDPNTAYSMTTADALLSNYAVTWPVAMEWNEKCDYPSPTLPRYLNHWVRHPSNMANMFGWWTRTQMIKIRALLVKLPVCVHVGHIWF